MTIVTNFLLFLDIVGLASCALCRLIVHNCYGPQVDTVLLLGIRRLSVCILCAEECMLIDGESCESSVLSTGFPVMPEGPACTSDELSAEYLFHPGVPSQPVLKPPAFAAPVTACGCANLLQQQPAPAQRDGGAYCGPRVRRPAALGTAAEGRGQHIRLHGWVIADACYPSMKCLSPSCFLCMDRGEHHKDVPG